MNKFRYIGNIDSFNKADLKEFERLNIDVEGYEVDLLNKLNTFEHLNDLGIYYYPAKNFMPLANLQLTDLDVGWDSKLESLDGLNCDKLGYVMIKTAKKLVDVSVLNCDRLYMTNCKKVDYSTFTNMTRCRKLELFSQGTIQTLDFLKNMTNLVMLEIQDTKLNLESFEVLADCPTIKYVGLPSGKGLKRPHVVELSKRYPHILFEHGSAALLNCVDLMKDVEAYEANEKEIEEIYEQAYIPV